MKNKIDWATLAAIMSIIRDVIELIRVIRG
jgi:hypothetical protein